MHVWFSYLQRTFILPPGSCYVVLASFELTETHLPLLFESWVKGVYHQAEPPECFFLMIYNTLYNISGLKWFCTVLFREWWQKIWTLVVQILVYFVVYLVFICIYVCMHISTICSWSMVIWIPQCETHDIEDRLYFWWNN